ncbi:hypothetical protein SAMN05216559_0859 [Halomicrobium zhouii]|uniref:Uncharacterized protein n=1 Tax=Halomicrobium zhouii TaxID=767519 RepID=A0A1I6KJB8_9EURY|nr:hypothetical protein [Halomicrobium zhouii]SFR90960.1 hypothetical protein SAMN05216559_0859 [Halomicrobium zhouii]
MDRAQLPLSLLEVAIGIVFVLGVTLGFALGVPSPNTREPQLDAYAHDTATILSNEQPRHGGATRLAEVVESDAAFQRERDALRERVDRILTDNLLFRVETPHGAVGYHTPHGVATGRSTVTTRAGPVTIRVWYV